MYTYLCEREGVCWNINSSSTSNALESLIFSAIMGVTRERDLVQIVPKMASYRTNRPIDSSLS